MKRTRLLAILAIAMVAGLVVTGCKGPMDPTPKVGIASTTWIPNLQPATYTIWAGQNQNAGTVTVKFDATKLYITYDLTMGNWWLQETHAHVATSLSGIPQKNGNPIPGKFEFSNTFNPRVQAKTYEVPIRPDWEQGTELYIATHCVVVQKVGSGYTNRQTGWSGPYDFPGHNWAKYIKYRRFIKDVSLPDYVVRANVDGGSLPGFPPSTFTVRLTGITEDIYNVWNYPDTSYPGWCAEHDKGILEGFEYDTKLHSTENWTLQGYPDILPDRWDNVNYLLNHKLPGATADEIQVAIWWLLTPDDPSLLDSEKGHPLVGKSLLMHDEALLYGEGWHPVPGAGQLLAAFLDIQGIVIGGGVFTNSQIGFDIQPVFIEIDP